MSTGSFIFFCFASLCLLLAIIGGKSQPKEYEMPNNEARLCFFLCSIIFLLTAILFK